MIQQYRIFSIDVFRAITMLLMIFVNDFWSLTGIPLWLEHARADQDFLGFSDIVFPCFLFIVGMSIPYAMRNRIAKGETHFQILRHILFRSLALLVMGFFTVNISELNIADHAHWFKTLIPGGGAFQGFAFAGIAASLFRLGQYT